MEKMIAMLLNASIIRLWLGEVVRMGLFPDGSSKHDLYSGEFILIEVQT
jgi:hypothetical protein